jgi:hypothetical protein
VGHIPGIAVIEDETRNPPETGLERAVQGSAPGAYGYFHHTLLGLMGPAIPGARSVRIGNGSGSEPVPGLGSRLHVHEYDLLVPELRLLQKLAEE